MPQSDYVVACRWNPRSEHLQRKAFGSRGRTGSLDELEEFAKSYGRHGRRGEGRDPERDYDLELRPRDHYPTYRAGSPPRRYRDDDDDAGGGWHSRHSPPPSPRKRRDTGDSERRGHRRNSYDDTFLNTLLERKARGGGERGGGGRGARGEGDESDTPSKGSSKKSSDCYYSRSPSNRPEEDDPLPPYTELVLERHRSRSPNPPPNPPDRYRTVEPSSRPFSYTRPANGLSAAHTLQERRDERDKARKVVSYL